MPKLFRTLGPVGPPVNDEDIANKGYVDNISPDSLTYFRLGETQITNVGNPPIYPIIGDFGLGDTFNINNSTRFSRAPFPMRIKRFGLAYQPTSITAYNNFISAPYVLQLIRYNPSTISPPAVVLVTGTLQPQQKNLDLVNDIPIGTGATDVYQWTAGTSGSATNIGSVNLALWYEFIPVTQLEIKSGEFQKELDEFNEKAELRTRELLKENPDLFKNLNLDSVDEKIKKKN